ncbi:MAG: hypothetical protein ABW046_22660 [Actinoplanes sp.]
MPNPTPAKYTVQIGPTYSVETAAELTAWAALQGRSVSEVTRECTEEGLRRQRRRWERDHGTIPFSVLNRATEDVAARGDRQAARKRKWQESEGVRERAQSTPPPA